MAELKEYLDLLSTDAERFITLFAGEPMIDDPRTDHLAGIGAVIDFLSDFREWSGEGGGGEADIVAVTDTEERTVVEYILHLVRDGKDVPLPVAIAGDRKGEAFSVIRVYHSMWPLLDRHVLRQPLLDEDLSLMIPDIIGRYHDALTRGDLEDMMEVFEDDGYAREPAGGPYIYEGKEKLREFYGMLFTNGGGIGLEHCTFTDDGVRGALEYNAISWGKTAIPPQAGIAVYERGESGLLHAARIYDDVNPPV